MTPEKKKAAQRVAIAKDALAWVRAGALLPAHCYFMPDTIKGEDALGAADIAKPQMQLRDLVIGRCQVCALGALFVAKAVRYDEVTVGDASSNCGIDTYDALSQHFDRVQLGLIESAYEALPYDTDPGLARAIAFGERFVNDKRRMTAILENIIANNGTFKP